MKCLCSFMAAFFFVSLFQTADAVNWPARFQKFLPHHLGDRPVYVLVPKPATSIRGFDEGDARAFEKQYRKFLLKSNLHFHFIQDKSELDTVTRGVLLLHNIKQRDPEDAKKERAGWRQNAEARYWFKDLENHRVYPKMKHQLFKLTLKEYKRSRESPYGHVTFKYDGHWIFQDIDLKPSHFCQVEYAPKHNYSWTASMGNNRFCRFYFMDNNWHLLNYNSFQAQFGYRRYINKSYYDHARGPFGEVAVLYGRRWHTDENLPTWSKDLISSPNDFVGIITLGYKVKIFHHFSIGFMLSANFPIHDDGREMTDRYFQESRLLNANAVTFLGVRF